MRSYPVVANGDLSPMMNRKISEYMQQNDIGLEHENIMRDTVVNVLVLRGMAMQKAIQQTELATVFGAAMAHVRDALVYRQELLADPALDDWSRDYLDAFTTSSITIMATNFQQSGKSFADTMAEVAERRPNPRSEPLRGRVRDVPALPPPSPAPSRPIAVRPAGWLEKLSRQTFVIEE